ncbi:MAG: fumarate hydratase C-terminal domain-containing protein [Elusimicrobia bacterium]|nr:fumarate hydratase C-terminal domain-containing protein [Elusimicrobiota bacterium]
MSNRADKTGDEKNYEMTAPEKLILPLLRPEKLRAGDFLRMSGFIAVARDRTFKMFFASRRKSFPGDGAVFYCGPIVRAGKVVSAGPTTSSRMDWAVDKILKSGVNVIIGKGALGGCGAKTLKKRGVYLEAPGGAGALLASRVISVKTVSYEELGPQALRLFEVRGFPLIVSQDYEGRNIWGEKP